MIKVVTISSVHKYKIAEILRAKDVLDYRDLRQKVMDRCHISRNTFANWLNIGINDNQDIPAKALDIIADVLGTTAEALKNYNIKKLEN